MGLNNEIMQNILESKIETNIFGYNVNNSDDLKNIWRNIIIIWIYILKIVKKI